MKNQPVLISFLVFIVMTSCLCSPSGFLQRFQTQKVDDTVTPIPIISEPVETPTTLPEIEVTTIPQEKTSRHVEAITTGPWLIFSTQEDLWIANQDGTDINLLVAETRISQPLTELLQPGGSMLAVITQDKAIYSLSLVSIPDGKVEQITELGQEQSIDDIGSPAFEAMRAFTEQPTIAWSPDGLTLAFVGAMEDDIASIYFYNFATSTHSRAESEPVQAFRPSWSPDGQYLLFFTADTFGTGAGYAMDSLWSIQASDLTVNRLEDLKNSGGDEILGWADPSTVIVSSWNALCGNHSIRRLSITNGDSQILRKECYVDAAVNDIGGVLYGTGEHAWLIPPDKNKGSIVLDGVITDINWIPGNYIFQIFRQESPLISLDRLGKDMQEAPQVGINDVSMYGAIWAWTDSFSENPGVWTSGMGLETQKIFEGPAYSPIWDIDNNLLFASEDQLFRATFSTYQDANPVSDLPDTIIDSAWAGLTD